MKKLLLIPSILTIGLAPMVSMVGCGDQDNPDPEPEEHDYSKDCLTFTALEECEFAFINTSTAAEVMVLPDLQYSTNEGKT